MIGRFAPVPPPHALQALSAGHTPVGQPPVSRQVSRCKYLGMALVTLALVGCSVPVVILAMHTAKYVFGR